MTKRTRYFFAGSMMVLIIGLCTGLVAYYNGGLSLRATLAASEDLAYLPADSQLVAYANVRQIVDAQLTQRLRQLLPSGEEKARLLAETGIDIEKDIDTVVAGLAGNGRPIPHGGVVLVRGRFKQDQIQQLLEQHGGRAEDYAGKRLVLSPEESAGVQGGGANVRATACVAFLEPGLVALGNTDAVKGAIDARAAGTGVLKNDELMKFISSVESTNNMWIVGRFDAVTSAVAGLGGGHLPKEATDGLSMVQWFAVTGHINGGMTGSVRVEARDEKSGDDLRDIVRGGLAAAHLLGGQDVKVETMLKSLQVSGSGKNVKLTFSVPAEVFDMANGIGGIMKHIGK